MEKVAFDIGHKRDGFVRLENNSAGGVMAQSLPAPCWLKTSSRELQGALHHTHPLPTGLVVTAFPPASSDLSHSCLDMVRPSMCSYSCLEQCFSLLHQLYREISSATTPPGAEPAAQPFLTGAQSSLTILVRVIIHCQHTFVCFL